MLEINGDTSQIDVIAVTNAGIFVIEVKNYCADKIFCNPDWKYWYYLLPDAHKTVQKCTFYNPIWQNATHVELISEMFHHTVPVYNIVMFSKNNPLAFRQRYALEESCLPFLHPDHVCECRFHPLLSDYQ